MLMTGSFVAPLLLLSLIPHQEPRFLIPVTLPLIFLHAQEVHDFDTAQAILYHTLPSIKWTSKTKPFKVKKEKRPGSLRTAWVVINTFFLVFFGFLHQGGVYPLADHLQTDLYNQHHPNVIHLVTSHTYPVPQYLLFQQKANFRLDHSTGTVSRYIAKKKFFLTEMGSRPMGSVTTILDDILTSCSLWKPKEYVRCTVYLALPSSLLDEFSSELPSNMTYKIEKSFYPHLSTEAIPEFYSTWHTSLHSCQSKSSMVTGGLKTDEHCDTPKEPDYSPSAIFRRVSRVFKQLSLSLVRVQKTK